MPKQVWSRDRFICTGNITEGVAKRTVRNSANEWLVETMIIKITAEREQVRSIVKDEIEAMMRLGAEVQKCVSMTRSRMPKDYASLPRT